jgi:hypothetical protein
VEVITEVPSIQEVVLVLAETEQTVERMVATVVLVFKIVLQELLHTMAVVEAEDGIRAMFPEQVAQAVEQMVPQATIRAPATMEQMDWVVEVVDQQVVVRRLGAMADLVLQLYEFIHK